MPIIYKIFFHNDYDLILTIDYKDIDNDQKVYSGSYFLYFNFLGSRLKINYLSGKTKIRARNTHHRICRNHSRFISFALSFLACVFHSIFRGFFAIFFSFLSLIAIVLNWLLFIKAFSYSSNFIDLFQKN